MGGKGVLRELRDIEFVLLVTDVSLEEMKTICDYYWDPTEVLQMEKTWFCTDSDRKFYFYLRKQAANV